MSHHIRNFNFPDFLLNKITQQEHQKHYITLKLHLHHYISPSKHYFFKLLNYF